MGLIYNRQDMDVNPRKLRAGWACSGRSGPGIVFATTFVLGGAMLQGSRSLSRIACQLPKRFIGLLHFRLKPPRPLGFRLIHHTMKPDAPHRSSGNCDVGAVPFSRSQKREPDGLANRQPLAADAGKSRELVNLKGTAVDRICDPASQSRDVSRQVRLKHDPCSIELPAQDGRERVIAG
jgi:hypothetical protein